MRPTLRQLQYLVAIADTGRFGEAAKRTNVSQPSLSAQIADMEAHLGTILFERGRHGALLTPIGEQVTARARLILQDVAQLKLLARQSSKQMAGRYKLGVLPSIGPYLLPKVTRTLHAEFPELRLSVSEERTIDLAEHLVDGHLDIIISTQDKNKNCTAIPILHENLYICVAPDDVLADERGPVRIDALTDRTLLSLGAGHQLSFMIQKIADISNGDVSSAYEGTSLDAIRQMAAMGVGVAILPSLYAISEAKRDPDLIVRRIDHPIARRQVDLMWRTSSPLGETFEKLGGIMRSVADEILA